MTSVHTTGSRSTCRKWAAFTIFFSLSRRAACPRRCAGNPPSLQTDVRNAGGTWVDEEVGVDDNLVTSRKPDDLPAFNAALLEIFG
jgi:putative intracellular protease/amidase